jgi:hypothetical protein
VLKSPFQVLGILPLYDWLSFYTDQVCKKQLKGGGGGLFSTLKLLAWIIQNEKKNKIKW